MTAPPESDPRRGAPHEGSSGSRRLLGPVLLVEDDDGDALLVRELLRDGLPDVAVVHVRHVADAVARLTRSAFGCVLLDLGLPDAAGADAVPRVIAASPGTPVVVLTGAANERLGIGAVSAGAQDYLVKGQVDHHGLARAIRYAVERRRSEEAQRQLAEAERRREDNARMERSLLPAPLMDSTDVEVRVLYRAGRDGAQLGGDFYDAVECADGRLHLLIGDVSGHGADEAALGVALRSSWRALVLADLEPGRVVATLDAVLRTERHHPTIFATLAMVTVAADRRRASVLLAGHPPPMLLGPDPRLVTTSRSGPLLGVLRDPTWVSAEVDLGTGWALLLYTDGVFEGRAGPGSSRRLDLEGLQGLVVEAQDGGLTDAALLEHLARRAQELHGGPLTDDIALSLARWSDPGGAADVGREAR